MELGTVEAIIKTLNDSGVRYLVAGGLAVVAHGFVRFTADVDLVLDLEPQNLNKAIAALSGLGYRPRAPVEFREFASAEARRRWADEKGLRVFSLFSPKHPATEIDLFVEEPFVFEQAYARLESMDVATGVSATFVGFDDLVEMKLRAHRPHDLQDVEGLKALRQRRESP
jgi:hypothetical protein